MTQNFPFDDSNPARLAANGPMALFLDIDGTLLDVALSPEAVAVPAGLAGALARLHGVLDGAVALVTGRQVASADRLFAPLELVTSGVHGTELRETPGGRTRALAPALPEAFIGEIADAVRFAPGVLVEPKGAGVAVHYRLAPEAGPALEWALADLLSDAPAAVELKRGRKVFEIGPARLSKGTAIETLAAMPPFRGRAPVFIGDDVGDEPAFAAVERLGGLAFKVAGERFGADEAYFKDPGEVRAWLSDLAHGLEKEDYPVNRPVDASACDA